MISKTKIDELPGEEDRRLEDAISPGMIPRRTTAENMVADAVDGVLRAPQRPDEPYPILILTNVLVAVQVEAFAHRLADRVANVVDPEGVVARAEVGVRAVRSANLE